MSKKNPHWGTALDAFLTEDGIREAAKAEARDARRRLATDPGNGASGHDEGGARRTHAHQPRPSWTAS